MRSWKSVRLGWCLVVCLLLPRLAPAQDVFISEFMADNENTLRDADGDSSDWIEIYNPGAAPANLDGWYLTDLSFKRDQWRFPAVTVGSGSFLIVFASGKDRTQGAELHANFSLAAEGGYLALFKPDGITAATEFAPYPAQRPDISFGFGQVIRNDKLVAAGLAARFRVPADGSLGATWIGNPAFEPFNDSPAAGWTAATLGIGYQQGTVVESVGPPQAYWSFDQTSRDLTSNGYDAAINGAAYTNAAPAQIGGGQSLSFNGTSNYASVEIDVSEAAFTSSLWFKADTGNCGIFTIVDGDLGANGFDRLLYLAGTNIAARTWNNETISSTGKNYVDGKWHHLAHVVGSAIGGQRIYVDGVMVASGAKSFSDFNWQQRANIGFSNDASSPYFDGLIDDVAIWPEALTQAQVQALVAGSSPLALNGYRALIQTDVASSMLNINASVYLRIPFSFSLPADFNAMHLRLQYDDGVIVYLNGVEVARRNAPAAAAFNSAALADRSFGDGLRPEVIDLSSSIGLLRQGANVLAIQGLNDRAGSGEFVVLPELVKVTNSLDRYLFPATPGAANSQGVTDFVADPVFSAGAGYQSSPFNVAITCATPGAAVYYTTNGSEPLAANPAATLYAGPVAVNKTLNLRAAGFKTDFKPSNTITRSYIFASQVAAQAAAQPGLPASWAGIGADYAVDARVISSTLPGHSFADALQSIPTVVLSTDPANLFSAATGIYYNPGGRGLAWERPAAIEWINPDGTPGFQANCGIRMHGNSSRDHGFTPKHPFRLNFRREYGFAKLHYKLFQDSKVDEFDQLLLRGASTDSWPVVDGGPVLGVQRWAARHATYMRDQWMRDAQLAMGRVSGHGTYVHLFLNNLYWGLYNFAERPVDSFNANYFGGSKEEYDVFKDFAELESGDFTAWNEMIAMAGAGLASEAAYQKIQGRNPDGSRNAAFPIYVDVDNLMDYMILHIASGAEDWPHHNWWGARRRGPESTGFKFFVWDQEISNDSLVRQYTLFQTRFEDPVPSPSPSYLYGQFKANATFRQKFIDRVHKLLFNGGLLSPEQNSARWRARQAEIDHAIVGESARWGDSKRNPPYKRETDWLVEMDFEENTYWPQIQPIAVERFRRVGLYPTVEAPVFQIDGARQHGGQIDPGARLTLVIPEVEGFIDTPLLTQSAPASAVVPVSGVLGTSWTQLAFVEGSQGVAWRTGANGVGYETGTGYETAIKIDVGAQMFGATGTNTVYIRLPFTVSSQAALNAFEKVTLRMYYDDGFIAYINGTRVADANPPAAPGWDSAATAGVEASLATPSEYDVPNFKTVLRAGQNILAIHGMNFSNTSSDMLILAEIVGRTRDDSVPAGTAFYTVDGSDPKNPGATPYTGPITLNKTTLVKARAIDGGVWSALNDALFVTGASLPLVVSEMMYHPAAPPAGSPYDLDEFEFIELQNTGGSTISLLGAKLSGGIEFDFLESKIAELPPDEFVVVVKNLAAFRTRYDVTGLRIAGEYQGKLDNAGEALLLKGPLGQTLLEFAYVDSWEPTTDGLGDSLNIVDAGLPAEEWSDPASWKASSVPGGTPGAPDGSDGIQRGWQRPGDANQDGQLDLGDAVRMLLILFRGGAVTSPCGGQNALILDFNGDARMDVSDAVVFLQYLFAKGNPPAIGTQCQRLENCPDVCQ